MLRRTRDAAAAIVTAVVLAGATPAAAQTATTTTTTTTTLLPHPLSGATAACIRHAKADRRACRSAGGSNCTTAYETAFGNCFAAGAGVKCATKCAATEDSCFAKLPTTKTNCRKSCATAKAADVKACRRIANDNTIWAGGDAGCLTTAGGNFDLCRSVCAGLAIDCHTSLRFCIANCQNL